MRLSPTDPDIQTLYGRIKNNKIDLQPDFQRGEVWSDEKKKALIDTILRGWHVPPIHIIVVEETGAQEVLDGQQRLVAIRDFMSGDFPVDGYCEPLNSELMALNGCFYKDLPPKFKNNFDNYAIRQFLITDFEPGEPGELFHRLNQHVRLTPAEKRNAFYGPVRIQVKDLVSSMEQMGINQSTLGFSNSRMAYDDTLSKFLLYLERGSLREKITESDITNLFRRERGFDQEIIKSGIDVLEKFSFAIREAGHRVKFNKATFLSWLLFIFRVRSEDDHFGLLGKFLGAFESVRLSLRRGKELVFDSPIGQFENILFRRESDLIMLFNDRASSRVADVSSVLARDYSLHHCFIRIFDSIDTLGIQGVSSYAALSDKEKEVVFGSIHRNYNLEGGVDYDFKMVLDLWGDF